MDKIVLQQGETTSIDIIFDEPLAQDDILYFALSDQFNILLKGNSLDGEITRIDDTHFTTHLTFEQTFNLHSCVFELSIAKEGKTMVNISEKPIHLTFKPNRIKSTLL